MTTTECVSYRRLVIIANLVLNGLANDEYKNLSNEDKAIVDSYIKAKKIRQQLDDNVLLNNTSNDVSIYK